MNRYLTLFLTERGLRHQKDASSSAPPELDVLMFRQAKDPAETRRQLQPHLAEAVFLISERRGEIDAGMIRSAPKLRLILRLGSLAHDIDLDAARAAGVAVSTWPVRPVILVAEHTIMQMIALAKRLPDAMRVALAAGDWGAAQRTDEDTFAYNWSGRQRLGGLFRRTVGILGFGEIGAELARRLQGWQCTVLYHRRQRLPAQVEANLEVQFVEKEALLRQSDFLVNLLPYFPETDRSLGRPEFALMKPGACLVSCGSGSVIDETALAAALREGRLGGAALDTYEWEPIRPDNPLRLLALEDPSQNILLTPHVAAGSAEATDLAEGRSPEPAEGRSDDFLPILQFLRGEPLPYRIV